MLRCRFQCRWKSLVLTIFPFMNYHNDKKFISLSEKLSSGWKMSRKEIFYFDLKRCYCSLFVINWNPFYYGLALLSQTTSIFPLMFSPSLNLNDVHCNLPEAQFCCSPRNLRIGFERMAKNDYHHKFTVGRRTENKNWTMNKNERKNETEKGGKKWIFHKWN
jgi:hypothetical protein